MASESPEIEGHLRRVAEHDVHAFDRQVELVRDELGERRPDPLSEVDLARERRHGAVALETDALLEPLRILPIPHQDAALFTARMARPYTPHLQRLPARASRMATSSGARSRARRAAAEMSIPLVQ